MYLGLYFYSYFAEEREASTLPFTPAIFCSCLDFENRMHRDELHKYTKIYSIQFTVQSSASPMSDQLK